MSVAKGCNRIKISGRIEKLKIGKDALEKDKEPWINTT